MSEPKYSKIFTAPLPEMSKEEEARFKQLRQVGTTPRDERFPHANQALHCWNRYNEWLVCVQQAGNDEEPCQKLRQYTESICPGIWLEKWEEQREEGSFSGIGNRFEKHAHH